VAGNLFVVGDGDCGQFGLGEDVVEAPRPIPTSPAGLQARKLAPFMITSILVLNLLRILKGQALCA